MLTACFGNFFIFLLIHSKEDSRVNVILLLRHWFCSQVSIAVVNSMTKTNLGSKGRISAYSPSLKVVRGGTEGKAAYLLAPSDLLSLISYTTEDHQPHGDNSHSSRPVNQKSRKCLTTLPTCQSTGDFFSLEVPSSLMALTHAKLTN